MNMKVGTCGAIIMKNNVLVTLKPVDVKIDRADVKLGWRAIIKKKFI